MFLVKVFIEDKKVVGKAFLSKKRFIVVYVRSGATSNFLLYNWDKKPRDFTTLFLFKLSRCI